MSAIKEQRRGDTRISTESYNAMVRAAKSYEQIYFDPRDFVVLKDTQVTMVALAAPLGGVGGIDTSKLRFGFSFLADGIVRIKEGDIEHGATVETVSQTDVTIPEGATQYVFVEYVWDSRSGTIPTPVTTRPITSDNSFKKPIIKASRAAGASLAKLESIEWLGGNIHIPGAFA